MGKETRQTVEVTPEAKQALDALAAWSRLPQRVIVERLLIWAGEQRQDVTGPILMAIPQELQPDFANLVLERLRLPKQAMLEEPPIQLGGLHAALKEALRPLDLSEAMKVSVQQSVDDQIKKIAAKHVKPVHGKPLKNPRKSGE